MPQDSAKSSWWRATVASVPVVLVNGTAFVGQFAFLHQHVPWVLPGQLLVAFAIESIAVYLAWHAHLATMSNDSSGRLKAGAYFFAQIVGAMNYSHYSAPHWRPTVMAVLMYFMSALSPILWGIHTHRASRDKLMERGLIEEHSVRLGATRWMWHIIRSARVTYWATWHGVNEPQRAIGHFAHRYGTADTPAAPRATRHLDIPRRAVPVTVPGTAPVNGTSGAPDPVPVTEAAPASVPDYPAQQSARPGGAPQCQAVPDGQDGPRVRRVRPLPRLLDDGEFPDDHAEVEAAAALRAEPSILPGQARRPGQEVISGVELKLAGMQDDSLPSVRQVARMLSATSDQRRLASQLLDQRRQAGNRRSGVPDGEAATGNFSPRPGAAPGMIASPRGFQPGGNGTHG